MIKNKHTLLGYFDAPEKAFNAYKIAKENKLKDLAEEYFNKGLIAENVYKAMINYEVNIND